MPPILRKTVVFCLFGLLATAAVGCGCKPRTTMKTLSIEVEREPSLNDRLVKVALFGATDAEVPTWLAEPAAKLTRPGEIEAYEKATRVLYLAADGQNTIMLPRDDAVWRRWKAKKAWTLVAVADVPDGRAADRRERITLDACDWKHSKAGSKLKLRVAADGIDVVSPEAFAGNDDAVSPR